MDATRFDALSRLFAQGVSRRGVVGVALGAVVPAWLLADAAAGKGRKKSCGPCEKRKRGKCKPKPDGTECGEGQICRRGRCECKEQCGTGGRCLPNGSCARVCPADFNCGTGCGCGLESLDGPQFCTVNEGGCETFTQGCASSAECPVGQYCMKTNCAQAPFNRCIALCPN
jgi:hypothetical protein